LSVQGGVPHSGLFGGATFGLSNLTNGWSERALAYTSPAVAGFRGNASVYVDPDSDHDYNFGIAFQEGGLEVGVQFYNANGHQNWPQAGGINRAVRSHARYSRGDLWSLGASHERIRGTVGGVQSSLYVAGTLNPSSRVSISGSVGHVGDSGAVHDVTGTGHQAGVFYALFRQVRFLALYSHLNADDGSSRASLALGTTFQFNL